MKIRFFRFSCIVLNPAKSHVHAEIAWEFVIGCVS